MKLSEVDGRNYQKVLRELDIAKFPTLPEFLKDVRTKLIKKQKLSFLEESRGKALLKKYFKDFTEEVNSFQFETIDWGKFSHRMPLEFQKEGIKFLTINDRCILADDQGLGKSIQSIMASKIQPDEYKILIVTLNSLKYNFANEIRYFDNRISIIDTNKKDSWKVDKYTIIHYDAIKKLKDKIIETGFDILILDEVHKLKNSKTRRVEAFLDIFNKTKKEIKKTWLLTGTPIDNRPSEYYNLLKIIKHPIAADWRKYVETYCNGYIDIFGRWNTSGASNLKDLYSKTKSSILRRLKKDVLKDFPNKFRKSIYLELKDINGYKNCVRDYLKGKYSWMEDIPNPESANALTKLVIQRQFCAIQKILDGTTLDLIENEIEKGKKVLIFTNFTKVIDELYKILGPKICSKLNGEIPVNDRQLIVDEFNNSDEKKVFLLNYAVGAVGYNLQSANTVIINDQSWKPSDMNQGEDRAYRIGQDEDVNVLYPIYKNSVEEAVYEAIKEKTIITSTILDGKESSFIDDKNSNLSVNLTEKDMLKIIFEKIDSMNLKY